MTPKGSFDQTNVTNEEARNGGLQREVISFNGYGHGRNVHISQDAQKIQERWTRLLKMIGILRDI